MPPLSSNATKAWKKKDGHKKLEFEIAGPDKLWPAKGTVKVKVGANSNTYARQQDDLNVAGADGSITNDTGKTIDYKLS